MGFAKNEGLLTRKASAWFKGLAIIMVILSHYAEWWSWFYTEEGVRETIRFAISQFGPYGVAIFLLFSGYGLVKTVGDKRIGGKFILKRVLSVYMPYLLMVVLIELFSDGLNTFGDVIAILYGHDFWYMTVMFSFYIAFIVVGVLFVNSHIRACLNVIFTITYSYWLYRAGKQDFWYISNIAFAVGVLFAVYEPLVKKMMDKAGVFFLVLLGAGSVCVIHSTLFTEPVLVAVADERWSRILAILIFTLFVAVFAAIWKWYDPVICFLGKNSLYLYLVHTFVFMWAINRFEYEISVRFGIATIWILVIALSVGIALTKLTNWIYAKVDSVMKK